MLTLGPGDVSASCFIAPHPRLIPYITTYYFTAIESQDGELVRDWLNPEWAGVRYVWIGDTSGTVRSGPFEPSPRAQFAGPTTVTLPFGATRAWVASIGILPLGWHRFMREPAVNWANRIGGAGDVASIVPFGDMLAGVQAAGEPRAISDYFDSMFLAAMDANPLTAKDEDDERRIIAAHAALIDPAIASVAELTERLDMTVKQLHRFSVRVFGFTPKVLIRRQRFIRTMAAVIHNPAANWAEALDLQYYDQPHFNRDFREFFDMSPDQYRREPHQIMRAAAQARMKLLGDPLQALHRPDVAPKTGQKPGQSAD